MKKFLSLTIALVLALSMTLTISAADTTITVGSTQNAETVVTYGPSNGYTVVIPEAVVIDATTDKGSATISAENVVIGYGKTLNITISGDDYDDAWKLIDAAAAANTVNYIIGTTDGGDDIVNNSVVLSSAAGANWNSEVEETLYFTIDEDVEMSGNYSDTLTFTVSID